jgi:hypothetical protein
MKKRRQHHVWQYYLKAWATDGQIFCLRAGKIFLTNTVNIAQDRDFYKFPRLTKNDIALARFMIANNANPYAKQSQEQFLAGRTKPITMYERIRMRLTAPDELDAAIDVYRANALENLHAGIETKFMPLLDRIRAGDLSFYEDTNDCIAFTHFIAVQYMRTKAIRDRTLKLNRATNLPDLGPIWNLLTYMYSMNIGCSPYGQPPLGGPG